MDLRLPTALRFGDVEFDQLSGSLQLRDQVHRLRPQTAAVLAYLLSHAQQIVSKSELQDAVWADAVVTDNSLTQCISEIRRALGSSADALLETVPRRGYVIHARVDAIPELTAHALLEPVAPSSIEPAVVGPEPVPASKVTGFSWPWAGWRWGVAGLLALVAAGLAWWYTGARGVATATLSLAVLPLEAKAGDADLAWFGDVVGEDLSFNLSKVPGVRVISRVSTQAYPATGMDVRTIGQQLGVRYLVGGGLRREGGQIVLSLHLADTRTGQQDWAERFTTSVAELPRTEHWAAQRIAQSLHLELIQAFAHQTGQLNARQLDAHTLALQSWAAWNLDTPQDAARAKALALQALALDDHSVLALKTMASWHLRARINQSMPAEEALAGAQAYAQRAMAVDPSHPLVHTVMGGALTLRGQHEQAIRLLAHEIETNPSHPVAYYFLGLSYLMQGEPDRAAQTYEQLLSISPRDTRLSRYQRNLAMAYLHQGRLASALPLARAATQAQQPFPNAWAALASLCALNGEMVCSREALARFVSLRPGFDIARLEDEWPPGNAAFAAQHAEFVRGLRLAGMPDAAGQP